MGKAAGDDFFKQYEAKMKKAEKMAFISNVMYSLNWFLGFCALTWASAVILGGLLTDLTQHDYYSVVALLLLEAVRLSTTTFFGKFFTLKLVHGSADPQRLVYNDASRQNLLGLARIIEQAVRLTVFAISILVPIRRLLDLNALASTIVVDDFDGLKTSLRIFYVLVLVNGAIAGLAVMFSTNVVPFVVDSFSLRKYYEKIVWKGMDEGLLHATDFELLSWTFEMQADEYRSNTRALVVKDLYADMMKFLYFHPRHKGFEAAKVALESNDTFQKEAAANIVGLWVTLLDEMENSHNEGAPVQGNKSDGGKSVSASPSTEEANESENKGASSSANVKKVNNKQVHTRLLIQEKLLAKLAEAIDSDESGRAASSSFLKLAMSNPKSVLMVRGEGKEEKVADILMDRIHWTVELGRPKNALMYIKAMIPLLPYLIESPENHRCMIAMKNEEEMNGGNIEHGIGKYCIPGKLRRLKDDMWTIVSQHASGLKRLQAVAAHVYDLLLRNEEPQVAEQKREELHGHLMEKPKERGHILKDELEHLLKLLGMSEMPSEWNNAIEVRPIMEERKTLPMLARPTTAAIANLGSNSEFYATSHFAGCNNIMGLCNGGTTYLGLARCNAGQVAPAVPTPHYT